MDVRDVGSLDPNDRVALFQRDAGVGAVMADVRDIVDRVRDEGDVAVREYTREFDGIDVGNLDITDRAERAVEEVDEQILSAIRDAAANIRAFHERQLQDDWHADFDGRELGRRFQPVESVGVYAPGGIAAYPSSALMTIIPATVAGVDHIAVTTPPAEELNAVTLAAIHEAGADTVYQVGGAQAIAALAYGTETVAAADLVVGPGNQWVTAAKAVVQGDVKIDFLAGPSELLILADETADPRLVAADLVAQAEHDTDAAVALITSDGDFAEAVAEEIEQQLPDRARRDIIRDALDNEASGLFVARSTSEAVLFADEYAPEHLAIVAENDEALLDRIDNAAAVFLGQYSPVAAGDYASGPNHVLPTGGGARITGGLSVDTFRRATTVQRISESGLAALRETITTLAAAEELEAHAESVAMRFDED